jgi:hypothetical protein
MMKIILIIAIIFAIFYVANSSEFPINLGTYDLIRTY